MGAALAGIKDKVLVGLSKEPISSDEFLLYDLLLILCEGRDGECGEDQE